MRKILLAAVGAVAMATASMASAAVTVSGATNLTSPNPDGLYPTDSVFITFGQGGQGSVGGLPDPFSGSFDFTNSINGIYNFVLQTSTDGVIFTGAVISGGACTPATCTLGGLPGQILTLNGLNLAAGTLYTFNFTGNNSGAPEGALTGNVSIRPAVPEPATWGMMLIGFFGVGMALRRRRQPALAQLA